MKKRKTKIICIEGVDGAGKGTLISALKEYFEKNSKKYIETREPGSRHVELCSFTRSLALDAAYSLNKDEREKALLMDRSLHLNNFLMPTIRTEKFDIILQDRGLLSSLAYAQSNGESLKEIADKNQEIFDAHKLSIYEFYDCLIYLDIDPNIALNRAKSAKKEFEKGDIIEQEGVQRQIRTREKFKETVIKFKNAHLIDVNNKNPEEVFTQVKNIIDKL